jgi:hypothetical protein
VAVGLLPRSAELWLKAFSERDVCEEAASETSSVASTTASAFITTLDRPSGRAS